MFFVNIRRNKLPHIFDEMAYTTTQLKEHKYGFMHNRKNTSFIITRWATITIEKFSEIKYT